VKTIIGSQQPILRTAIKAVSDLPGHMMFVYTDTVTLKSSFEKVEEKVYQEAKRFDLEIAFDLPTRYNGSLPEMIDKEKRYLSVAIYDKRQLNNPVVVNM
jgi:hypothetical protein